jgi:hypothetical protein
MYQYEFCSYYLFYAATKKIKIFVYLTKEDKKQKKCSNYTKDRHVKYRQG